MRGDFCDRILDSMSAFSIGYRRFGLAGDLDVLCFAMFYYQHLTTYMLIGIFHIKKEKSSIASERKLLDISDS